MSKLKSKDTVLQQSKQENEKIDQVVETIENLPKM